MITVVGLSCAPLDTSEPLPSLPPHGRRALQRAELVVGGARHLALVGSLVDPSARRLDLSGDLPGALDEVAEHGGRVCVVASGDPGFFGIVRALRERVGSTPVEVIPGVSAIAAVCASAGVSWDDALVVSAHGRDAAPAIAACLRHPKVVVLTQPGFGPRELAAGLGELPRRLVVGERLGLPGERVVTLPGHEAALQDWNEPNVVLVLDEAAGGPPKGWMFPARRLPTEWALPEDAFEHRGGMITKTEVRALALAWLGPGVGDLVWDIGAGSGAVGIEAARLGAAVIAVDADAQACVRMERNAQRHAVPLMVVCAHAPGALADLPDPDAVFVGGGGPQADVITAVAAIRARRAVVVTLATLERIAPVRAALEAAGLVVDATMLHAARVAPLAEGHRLAATNPVFVVRGVRRSGGLRP